eukprot:comp19479_c0_seq1/m.22690 comp19479_c0_seq1/g.22690  ORF comp19479_c0_seq1/g.22690 comp19479_c0_seq1/m.22690 type:complete len:226 (-) comp19479_c0_seq1:349-1026(-)
MEEDEDLFGPDSEESACEEDAIDSDDVLVDTGCGVDGLVVVRGFLPPHSQAELLDALVSNGYFAAGRNQAMIFGNFPEWALTLAHHTQQCAQHNSLLPEELVSREPLFDQMILNMYHMGDGIKPHVDLARFEDGIAIVSLGSSCDMQFYLVGDDKVVREANLDPGDLLLMHGPGRYDWMHGIKAVTEGLRISVTLRKLKKEAWLLQHSCDDNNRIEGSSSQNPYA